MEKPKRIISIVFCVLILLFSIYSINQQYASAISHVDINLGNTESVCYIDHTTPVEGGTTKFYFWVACSDANTANTDRLYKINAVTKTIAGTFTIDTRNNAGESHRAFNIGGITCSTTECYVALDAAVNPDQIVQVFTGGGITKYTNVTSLQSNAMDIEGTQLFIVDGTPNARIELIETVGMTIIGTYPNIGAFAIKDLKYVPAINRVAITVDAPRFELYNTVTATLACSIATTGSYIDDGAIVYNTDNSKFYVTTDSSDGVRGINQSCVETDSFLGAFLDDLPDIETDTTRNEIIVFSHTDTTAQFIAIDYSGNTVWSYTVTGNLQLRDSASYNQARTFLMALKSTTEVRLITLDELIGGGGTGTGTGAICFDINPIINFTDLVCLVDNDGDGIPDVDKGDVARVTGGNTTSFMYEIGCQIAFINCDNPNSKTNGVGLLLLLMLLLASIGVVMFVTFRTDHSLDDVHPVIWFLIALLDTGIAWQLNWVDGIPFFASIVAICALGAFKIREWFG